VRIDVASNMSAGERILYHSRLGLTIVPTLRSRMRFSRSAHEAPWIMAPITWLSAVSVFIGKPQSLTETILRTRTSPVSVSTSTSAKCAAKGGGEEVA